MLNLSEALQNVTQPNSKIFRLVEQNISFIDIIPEILTKHVETMYLSCNCIHTLLNIDQFKVLVTLSLSNNLLNYLEDLHPLRTLVHLTKLSLIGNAVVHLPYYREHVVSLCQKLQVLDDRPLSMIERAKLQACISEGVIRYEQLQHNELQNCLLRHVNSMAVCRCKIKIYLDIASTAEVLRQTILGGVLHWLQLMTAKDFSRMVQDKLLAAAGQFKTPISAATGKTNVADKTTCMDELLVRQHAEHVSLLSAPSPSSGKIKTGEQIPMQLQRINQRRDNGGYHSVKSPTNAASTLLTTAAPTARYSSRPNLVQRQHRAELETRYSTLLSSFYPTPLLKGASSLTVPVHPVTERPIPVRARTLSGALPPQQTEPVDLRSRHKQQGAQLGRQTSKSVRFAVTSVATVNTELVHSGHAHQPSIINTADSATLEVQELNSKMGLFGENVDGFLQDITLVLPFVGWEELCTAWSELEKTLVAVTSNSLYNTHREMLRAVASTNRGIALSSVNREGKGGGMHALHLEAHALSAELKLAQRRELDFWDAHRLTLEEIYRCAQCSQDTASSSMHVLNDLHTKVFDILQSLMCCQKLHPEAQSLLSEVVNCENDLKARNHRCDMLRGLCDDVNEERQSLEYDTASALQKAKNECSLVTTIVAEMNTDRELCLMVKTKLCHRLLTSISTNRLLMNTLLTLRRNTHRQRRIKLFASSCLRSRCQRVLSDCISHWRRIKDIMCAACKLSAWTRRKQQNRLFSLWMARWTAAVSRRLRTLSLPKLSRTKLSLAFSAIRRWPAISAEARQLVCQRTTCVALFLMVRVFRAWRDCAQRVTDSCNRVMALADYNRSVRFFLRWAAGCAKQRETSNWSRRFHLRVASEITSQKTVKSIKDNGWRAWLMQHSFRANALNFACRLVKRRVCTVLLTMVMNIWRGGTRLNCAHRLHRSFSAKEDSCIALESSTQWQQILRLDGLSEIRGNYSGDNNFGSCSSSSDDDDTDSLENDLILSNERCVMMALRGWRSWLTRKSYLAERAHSVAALRGYSAKRLAFRAYRSLYVASALQRTADFRLNVCTLVSAADVLQFATVATKAELSHVESSRQCEKSLLSHADELDAAVLVVQSALEEAGHTDFDLGASIAALSARYLSLSLRNSQLNDECAAILSLEKMRVTTSNSVVTEDGKGEEQEIVNRNSLIDDRLLLLRDVEHMYTYTVSGQSFAFQQRQNLQSRVAAEQQRVESLRGNLAGLESELRDCVCMRFEAEEAMLQCTTRTQIAVREVSEKADKDRSIVDSLNSELCSLKTRRDSLIAQQDHLVEHLHRVSCISHDTKPLGAVSLSAADYLFSATATSITVAASNVTPSSHKSKQIRSTNGTARASEKENNRNFAADNHLDPLLGREKHSVTATNPKKYKLSNGLTDRDNGSSILLSGKPKKTHRINTVSTPNCDSSTAEVETEIQLRICTLSDKIRRRLAESAMS